MYSYNNHTEAISCRLAPGLKGRIDFECEQYEGMNRNKFINQACELVLMMRQSIRNGNMCAGDLPGVLRRYRWILE